MTDPRDMHMWVKERARFGDYEAVHGRLAHDDSREAYVMGPTLSGRIAPLASFWRWEEAKAWAKEQHGRASEVTSEQEST